MQCPCCRGMEGNDAAWDFTIRNAQMEHADERERLRRSAEERYIMREERREHRERERGIVQELLKRTLGVYPVDQQQTDDRSNNRNNNRSSDSRNYRNDNEEDEEEEEGEDD